MLASLNLGKPHRRSNSTWVFVSWHFKEWLVIIKGFLLNSFIFVCVVRKWKDIVEEWVKLNQPGEHTSSALMADGDSPQQKVTQNGYHQVPDFAYSPNPHSEWDFGSDKNNSEFEPKPKVIPQKEAFPPRATPFSSIEWEVDRENNNKKMLTLKKLASARKRLQENYKEAENAKKQRTIQVMDIHEIPKPKNAFFGKNKGGGGGSSHGRHW
ncbi:probable mediator of RNA polymerase II transcription subunit 26c [Quercus robur]|uniref:probable mediator of RNA polymerase II transcription subunit 26c n=1 Tax=Quercus robur TaxID=38942 RepID=UPI00216300C7|nr:probable mediator of RNA polymerase II transcription subunit 26c [Quercus robur]